MRAFLSPHWTVHSVTENLSAAGTEEPGAIVLPHLLPLSGVDGVFAVAGFPTGAHQGLVKASEARLAIDQGAEGVFYVPLPTALQGDTYAAIAEVALLREAVPSPAILGVCLPLEAGRLAAGEGHEFVTQVLKLGTGLFFAPYATEADMAQLAQIIRGATAPGSNVTPQILAPSVGSGNAAELGIKVEMMDSPQGV